MYVFRHYLKKSFTYSELSPFPFIYIMKRHRTTADQGFFFLSGAGLFVLVIKLVYG